MRDSYLLTGLIALMVFTSCQKEINWKNDVKFCGVSSITMSNANGIVVEKYEFGYDTINRRPNVLRFQNLQTGISQTIVPQYRQDTIIYTSNTYVTVDASGRIKTLNTVDATTGKPLVYYYTYNIMGYLDQRLIDDGIHDAIRTNYTYDNGFLTGYQQDFQGYPLALSAVVSYQQSTKFNGYCEYSMIELFPELTLYLPTFQMGKMSSYAIRKVEKKTTNSSIPPVSTTDNYSNYSLNPEGWPQGFQTDVMVSGVPESTSKYSIDYSCF